MAVACLAAPGLFHLFAWERFFFRRVDWSVRGACPAKAGGRHTPDCIAYPFSRLREKVPEGRMRGALALAVAGALVSYAQQLQQQDQELSLPCGERVTFLCLCKEKITKRKHTLSPRPRRYATRVHSAGRIFRRDIPVSSKNDAHPCAPPHAGSCLPAPSLRKGPGKAKAESNNNNNKSNSKSSSNRNRNNKHHRCRNPGTYPAGSVFSAPAAASTGTGGISAIAALAPLPLRERGWGEGRRRRSRTRKSLPISSGIRTSTQHSP